MGLGLASVSIGSGGGSEAKASDWSQARYLGTKGAVTAPRSPDPVYQQVFASVSQSHLQQLLQESSGLVPVTVNGSTFMISNRYAPAAKQQFRAYFIQYFQSLGISAQEMSYPTQHSIGETQGHDVEAILPGKSKDSVVIIVHYDSIGPSGQETSNPGTDDDMSGMSILLETARILAAHQAELQHTVRFVAADYEEHSNPGLEGARAYATYIKNLAAQEGFKILAAVDDEQTGWSCAADGACDDAPNGDTFDVFSCSGDAQNYSFPALGDALVDVVNTYSTLKTTRGCIGENSDHYAMWEIGVPAVVFSEHNPFDNPHFDQSGGDTYDKINQDYYFKIAQVGVTFAATLVGLSPAPESARAPWAVRP